MGIILVPAALRCCFSWCPFVDGSLPLQLVSAPPCQGSSHLQVQDWPWERAAGGFGAGRSCMFWGPDMAVCYFFTSHSHLGLFLEYVYHILVLSSVGKYFLPALL